MREGTLKETCLEFIPEKILITVSLQLYRGYIVIRTLSERSNLMFWKFSLYHSILCTFKRKTRLRTTPK